MPGSHIECYLHLIWATLHRNSLLLGDVRKAVYENIQQDCAKLGAILIEINGTDDHVHVLVRMPHDLLIPQLAKQLKGASSHLMRQCLGYPEFQWQEGYAAFSVSRWDVQKLQTYLKNQEAHHQNKTAKQALEAPS